MQVFAPSTAIWFLINFQTCYQVLNSSEKLLINRSFIIQKIPMLFSFFWWSYIGGWKVRGFVFEVKACACVLVSVRLTGEEQSDILQLFFTTNSHKPKHSNLQEVVSMLGDDVCGNFIKNNIGPSQVSFRVISTHLDGCWLFFVGVGICWPRTIANFNITLFRPRAGVQPKDTFWVFSPVRFLIHTRTGLSPI